MRHTLRRYVPFFLGACLLGLGSFHQSARAEMIGTEKIVSPVPADQERERVKALAAREDVAKGLQAMGLSQEQVQARIGAMTDAEVLALGEKLDTLPAGGMTDFQFIVVILLTIIVVLLLV